MRNVQRLERLEVVEEERRVYADAERLAEEHGVPVEHVLDVYREVSARVRRWGIEAELRCIAQDSGRELDEVRVEYDEIVAELEDRERC